MKKLLLFILAALVVCGCGGEKADKEAEKGPVDIIIWHPWGGQSKDRFDKIVAYYNRTHKDIRVHAVYVPNNTSDSQKIFTSVAAGKVPDLSVVDGPQVVSWACQGALLPIDDYLKKSNLSRDDFFGPAYDEMIYKGKVWALHYSADPNMLFAWNKKIFREVGLDPDRPPKTLDELNEYDRKIRTFNPQTGVVERMGIIPWQMNFPPNAMFLWGFAFGGSFYDSETRTVTADNPRVIAALEWMGSLAKEYDITKISAFCSGFGGYEQSPFYIGKVAMTGIGPEMIEDINRYAPNLDYGVAPIPAPEGGEYGAAWMGGWCFGMLKGCPHPDEAWEFLRWLTADPEGTKVVFDVMRYMPAYKKSKAYEEITPDSPYWPFYQILLTTKHQRPIMPAQALLMGELAKAVDTVLYGRDSAENVMKKVNETVQKELDLRLAGE